MYPLSAEQKKKENEKKKNSTTSPPEATEKTELGKKYLQLFISNATSSP